MRYCDKFYELAGEVKRTLDECNRQVRLEGEKSSPFGKIPACMYYTGGALYEVSVMMRDVNRMLFSKWEPDNNECCHLIHCDSTLMGDTKWEKPLCTDDVINSCKEERFPGLRELCKHRVYHFPLRVEPDDKVDLTRVHPYKQATIKDILSRLKDMPWITELWLFGSSTQPYCTDESDIDIAYRVDNEMISRLQIYDELMQLRCIDPNGADFIKLDNVNKHNEVYYEIRRGLQLI